MRWGVPRRSPEFDCTRFTSESESRPERNTQVIVSSIIEIHLIASFQAETESAEESFDAATGISGKVSGSAAKLVECVVKRLPGYSSRGAVTEFGETDLARNKRAKGPSCAELEFGPE